jgi:ATP-dependent Lon protease
LSKNQPENYAQGYGFITDYLAEIFTRLRRRNYQTVVNARVDFSGLTGRNQDAIRKTSAGLLKLLFPDMKPTPDQFKEFCVRPAVELRQRIRDELHRLDPEYAKVSIGFK